MKSQIILASQSPRRSEILKHIGVDFTVVPSKFKEMEESVATKKEVAELTLYNAEGKAGDVASRIQEGVVIGVDTLVWQEERVYGKPRSQNHAIAMLSTLTKAPHFIFTGVCIIKKSKRVEIVKDFDVVKLYPRKTSKEFIKQYVKSKEPFDKAGGYTIERKGILFFRRIEGDLSTVLGLPITVFIDLLQKLNLNL